MSSRVKGASREFPRFQAFIGWSTLIIVVLSALPRGANWPVTWTLLAITIFGLFAMQVIVDAITGLSKLAVRLWPATLLFVLVLVWGTLQTIPDFLPAYAHPLWDLMPDAKASISADPRSGIHIVMRLAAYAMVFWIIMRSAENAATALWFTGFIAVATSTLAAFGIWAAITGENIILGETGSLVVQASFANQNSYATYAIFSILANLAFYLHLTTDSISSTQNARTGLRQFLERFFGGGWVFALGSLLCLAALFLTNSRAGIAAGVLAVVTFFVLYAQGKGKKALLYLLIPAILVTFAFVALSADVISRYLLVDADNLRFIIYPKVIEGISDRFWVGHGLEAFQETFRAYVPLEAAVAEWNEAHSSFLENFYEMGVPAASIFYAALLFVSVGILIGVWKRKHNRTLPCMAFACIIGAAAHSTVDFSLEIPAVTFLFAAILGIGWAQSFRRTYVEPR